MAELKIDSGAIDPIQLRTYETIARVASSNQVPFIIVGASARDLVMHHAYGAPIQRATRDIDLAIQVPDWEGFEGIRTNLIAEGYSDTQAPHRLLDAQGIPLDIIPFGPLANENATIAWPPDGDTKMGVMGFQEALEHADLIILERDPVLELPVASPIGLVLLKLIAWAEREARYRVKDAADLTYLLKNYENIPGIMDQLYDNYTHVLEGYDWDTRLTGAYLLGQEVSKIANEPSMRRLNECLSGEGISRLESDAGLDPDGPEKGLIEAFRAGLL